MDELCVDARGEVCPKPLLITKKALKDSPEGQPLRILIDNETSKDNVMRFLQENGYSPECIESDGIYSLVLFAASHPLTHPDAAAYCTTTASQNPHTIVIKNKQMGDGDATLGEILLKAFINTIKEITPLPGSIVFYNSGIFMALDDSPVLPALRELEKLGVKILVCGTCAEYFKKKEQIHIGTISNMYTILETITAAGKSIVP